MITNNEKADHEDVGMEEFKTYSITNIFIEIWFSPRKVFGFIIESKYDEYTYILLFLVGVVRAFDRATLKSSGDNLPLIGIVLMSIFIGGLFGWISYYIFSALLSWTGEWLKGKGDTKSILRMTAYAMIPSIVSLILLIPQILIVGNGIFQSNYEIPDNSLLNAYFYYLTLFIQLVLSTWSFALFVIGLSEVQKFNYWYAIANILISILVVLIPIGLAILLVSW